MIYSTKFLHEKAKCCKENFQSKVTGFIPVQEHTCISLFMYMGTCMYLVCEGQRMTFNVVLWDFPQAWIFHKQAELAGEHQGPTCLLSSDRASTYVLKVGL